MGKGSRYNNTIFPRISANPLLSALLNKVKIGQVLQTRKRKFLLRVYKDRDKVEVNEGFITQFAVYSIAFSLDTGSVLRRCS